MPLETGRTIKFKITEDLDLRQSKESGEDSGIQNLDLRIKLEGSKNLDLDQEIEVLDLKIVDQGLDQKE